MTKLSVAILTFNEEKNIKDCLESVKWADEIIVIDERSTDKTVEIAKKYTKKVFLVDHGTSSGQTHDTMFHKHKQLALEKCTGDWIFQIDADERISFQLKEEVLETINKKGDFSGFKVPRQNIIFGKPMRHTGWYPDYQVKLIRNGKGRYPCKTVHEQIEVDGKVGVLKSDLMHSHYTSVFQFIDRMNNYTTNDARHLLEKGENVTWRDSIKFPVDEFLKRFFLEEGYKDGLHGLVLSLFQSLNRLVVFAKIWEQQKFWEYGNETFLTDVVGQSKKVQHDWNHWLAVIEKNPVRKLVYKVKKYL